MKIRDRLLGAVYGRPRTPRRTTREPLRWIVRDVEDATGYRLEILMGDPLQWVPLKEIKAAQRERGLSVVEARTSEYAKRLMAKRPAGWWLMYAPGGRWRLLTPRTILGGRG